MSVNLDKHLTPEGAAEIVNCFAYIFGINELGHEVSAADKLEKWLGGIVAIDKARPFRRGDRVNVLGHRRGEYLRKNVLVVHDEDSPESGSRVVVADREELSVAEALSRCDYWDYPYHRVELVEAVDAESVDDGEAEKEEKGGEA